MSADGKRFHSSTLKSSTLIASEIIQKPRRIASMNVTQATRVQVNSFFFFPSFVSFKKHSHQKMKFNTTINRYFIYSVSASSK